MTVHLNDMYAGIRLARRREKLSVWEHLIGRLQAKLSENGGQPRKKNLAQQTELIRLGFCIASVRRLESQVQGEIQHDRESETPPGFPNGRLPNPWTRARKRVRD